jgi:hypothetical protein
MNLIRFTREEGKHMTRLFTWDVVKGLKFTGIHSGQHGVVKSVFIHHDEDWVTFVYDEEPTPQVTKVSAFIDSFKKRTHGLKVWDIFAFKGVEGALFIYKSDRHVARIGAGESKFFTDYAHGTMSYYLSESGKTYDDIIHKGNVEYVMSEI